jgi:hypothetical protein
MPLLPICNYVTVYMYDPSRLAGMSGHPRLEQDLSTLRRREGSVEATSEGTSEGTRGEASDMSPAGDTP